MTSPTLRDQGTTFNVIINSVSLILILFFPNAYRSKLTGHTTFNFDDHFSYDFVFDAEKASDEIFNAEMAEFMKIVGGK